MISSRKKLFVSVSLVIAVLAVVFLILYGNKLTGNVKTPINSVNTVGQTDQSLNPLAIEAMRARSYPGSAITIEQDLSLGSNYKQYITSYISDGLKIYALLTVPAGEKPIGGWPVIVFNHGYIPPTLYQTTVRYEAYVAGFAKSGYIVFKPDYRGNGNSQGQPEGAYYSPAYAIDDLNAIASIRQYKDVNPDKIGVWGHSMGGNITLRNLVISKDIKVAVIWGGVVGSYSDLMYNWQNHVSYNPPANELALRNRSRQNLISKYGTPTSNPDFWNSIDPTYFVSDITAPVQLDVGGSDEEVPVAFSQSLREKLLNAGKTVEYYEYPGSNHNISQGFTLAMERSVAFFDKYLK
jgi:dipeptidyl aminopeptidase/acylaminoacyl peptidase